MPGLVGLLGLGLLVAVTPPMPGLLGLGLAAAITPPFPGRFLGRATAMVNSPSVSFWCNRLHDYSIIGPVLVHSTWNCHLDVCAPRWAR